MEKGGKDLLDLSDLTPRERPGPEAIRDRVAELRERFICFEQNKGFSIVNSDVGRNNPNSIVFRGICGATFHIDQEANIFKLQYKKITKRGLFGYQFEDIDISKTTITFSEFAQSYEHAVIQQINDADSAHKKIDNLKNSLFP